MIAFASSIKLQRSPCFWSLARENMETDIMEIYFFINYGLITYRRCETVSKYQDVHVHVHACAYARIRGEYKIDKALFELLSLKKNLIRARCVCIGCKRSLNREINAMRWLRIWIYRYCNACLNSDTCHMYKETLKEILLPILQS